MESGEQGGAPGVRPEAYDAFALYYDAWQGAFGKQYWALIFDRLLDTFARYGQHIRSIADLGTGTGGLACALARRGYAITGIDRSPAMLAEAREKAAAARLAAQATFLEQDIRSFRLEHPVDAAVCFYTVINHLTKTGDLTRVFTAAHRALRPGGLFIFELNLPECYDRYWSGRQSISLDNGVQVIRNNIRRADTPLIVAELTIRTRAGAASEAAHDRIEQRIYGDSEVEATLLDSGFLLLARETYDPFGTGSEPVKELWVARR